MENPNFPTKGAVTTSASIDIQCDLDPAYAFVSNSEVLPQWLEDYGPIHGVKYTVIERGPYSFVGARRKIHFDDGSSLVEELTSMNGKADYTYRVTEFTNVFRHLIKVAHGQCAFEKTPTGTKVTWNYSFTCKNIFGTLFFMGFVPLVYLGFMKQCLRLAKGVLEAPAAKSS